jgi:DNA-binding Lrp family transcriptional regulator
MDKLDTSILMELRNNCRLSFHALARQFGLTPPAIRKRVMKMVESGVILRFTVEASLTMLDLHSFLALVSTNGSRSEDFVTLIGGNPMVAHVISCDGWKYVLMCSFDDSDSLFNLARFLRELEGVTEVKLHLLLTPVGKKIGLSNVQIRVLRSLNDDPRMKLTEIADKTGFSTKTVSRAVREVLESRAIRFTLHWNPSAGDSIGVLVQLCYDYKNLDINGVLEWLRQNHPSQFWEASISVLEHTIYGVFVAKNLAEMMHLIETIRQSSFVKSIQSFIIRSWQTFPDLRNLRLERMLSKS